jgi:hypothetical protein
MNAQMPLGFGPATAAPKLTGHKLRITIAYSAAAVRRANLLVEIGIRRQGRPRAVEGRIPDKMAGIGRPAEDQTACFSKSRPFTSRSDVSKCFSAAVKEAKGGKGRGWALLGACLFRQIGYF